MPFGLRKVGLNNIQATGYIGAFMVIQNRSCFPPYNFRIKFSILITVSLQQDSQYLDIDYEDVELKIAMPSYENVNYDNSAKNVSRYVRYQLKPQYRVLKSQVNIRFL